MNRFLKVTLVGALIATCFQSTAFADTDPFPGVAHMAEIPGTRISSPAGMSDSDWNNSSAVRGFSCPAGAGGAAGVDLNFTTTNSDDVRSMHCVKTWRPQETIDAMAAYRAQVDAAQASALAQSQAWNAANPGKQKCFPWGPFTDPNGGTSSGGICANPVEPGPGTTVPTQSADGVVGPSAPESSTSTSAPVVVPPNTAPINGNGYPYTVILSGQKSTSECPVGFQAANGIIAAIGTGTFTECWSDLAWKANRLGGTYWEQFKSSGGTYDVTPVLNAMAVVAEYKVKAKAIAQAAADRTPGVQRCSSWTVYGQTGEECAYAGIEPASVDSGTVTAGSDTATVTAPSETATPIIFTPSNLASDSATVALEPISALAGATPEDIDGDISAKIVKKKVVFSVSTNVPALELTIVASKKGTKSVKIELVTNSEGDKTLTSKINLRGYTLTLKSGKDVLDKFVLR